MVSPKEVVSFWLNDVGPAGWYIQDQDLDQKIVDQFGSTWQEAKDGGLTGWPTDAEGALAYIILTDQMPRNMFRGSGKSFATDRKALAAAKCAIDKGWDLRIDPPARQFFYLPMMHSENLCDQDRCVRLFCERMPGKGGENMLHAKAHREIIRAFGRFPYRNAALDRADTAQEAAYLSAGGYAQTLRSLQNL